MAKFKNTKRKFEMMEILRPLCFAVATMVDVPLFVCKLGIVGASVFGEGKGDWRTKSLLLGNYQLACFRDFLGGWLGWVSGQAT